MAMSRREFPPRKSLPDNRQSTSVVMFLIALFSPLVSMSFLLSVQHFSLLIGGLLIEQTNELTVLVITKPFDQTILTYETDVFPDDRRFEY